MIRNFTTPATSNNTNNVIIIDVTGVGRSASQQDGVIIIDVTGVGRTSEGVIIVDVTGV